jgi:ribosome maturation factor RimP
MSIEEKVPELVESDLKLLGLEIVRVRLMSGKTKTLEILLARIDGAPMSIEECRVASQHMSTVFDVEDIIKDQYRLEVSSAGLERPLVKLSDFEKFAGNVIDLSLFQQMDGRKKYRGTLRGIKDSNVLMNVGGKELSFEFGDIKSSNIVLTDELFRRILNNKDLSTEINPKN